MEYITGYFWYTEIFAICVSFAVAAIFSEDPTNKNNSRKIMTRIFVILFIIFSIFLNILNFSGYKSEKKEYTILHTLL